MGKVLPFGHQPGMPLAGDGEGQHMQEVPTVLPGVVVCAWSRVSLL